VQPGQAREPVPTTPFLTVPRWVVATVLVEELDVGRSNATRTTVYNIYGQYRFKGEQVTLTQQLVTNQPALDHLDIQRNGLRSYMTTTACTLRDQVGHTPSTWIALVADWTIGSHLTLNGTMTLNPGVQAPICEGDI
jgi:hypothetical protein